MPRFQAGFSRSTRSVVVRQSRPTARDKRGYIVDLGHGLGIRRLILVHSKEGSVRGCHYHRKAGHFVYVLSGRLVLDVRERMQEKAVRLKPGQLVWIPAGVYHRFLAREDSYCLEFGERPYDPGDTVREETSRRSPGRRLT